MRAAAPSKKEEAQVAGFAGASPGGSGGYKVASSFMRATAPPK
jgi:hypothetical protein